MPKGSFIFTSAEFWQLPQSLFCMFTSGFRCLIGVGEESDNVGPDTYTAAGITLLVQDKVAFYELTLVYFHVTDF